MKNKCKYMLVILSLFLLVGCGNMMNTPTKKVEDFLSKYQTQDKSVLDQLDSVVEEAGMLDDEQKTSYRNLMKKQYQNLSYKIKEENVDGDKATVVVEVEVYDYGKAISESETYLANNRSEFVTDIEMDTVDAKKFLDYKIEQMNKTKEKVKYTINFTLTKKDDKWTLDNISDIDRQKIHGLYY